MDINKNLMRATFIVISIVLVFSTAVLAQTEDDSSMNERMNLIEESQQLSQEQNEEELTSGLSLFVTSYHSGDAELNLGAKYENRLLDYREDSMIELNYVLEGIYLEGEDDNLAGFLSLKASLKDKMFAPYLGAGAEFLDKADYQAFVGLNLTNNLFVETKFIEDKERTDSDDFYSAVGFKINF